MKINMEIKEKVLSAANSLQAEGIDTPTNDQVRERMGGGSLSHISPVMREWREARKTEVVAALEMPADLRRAIESSVGQVWTTASKLACSTVETVRMEADTAIKAATAERDEVLHEVARLEDRLAQLQTALDEKDLVISQGREDLDKARSQGAQLASENAALASRMEDRETQISGLKGELKEARDDNKQLQAELIEIARRAGSA